MQQRSTLGRSAVSEGTGCRLSLSSRRSNRDRWKEATLTPTWIRPVTVGLLSLGLLTAACGSDDDDSSEPIEESSDSESGETTPGLDPEVVELFQTQLAAIGCYDGPVDGVDGAETTAAIERFQAAQGLEEDGVVGSETEDALKNAVDAGVEGCSADGE